MKHDSYHMTLLEDELYALCSESYPQPVQDWVGRIRSAAVEPMKLAQYIIDNAWLISGNGAYVETLPSYKGVGAITAQAWQKPTLSNLGSIGRNWNE